MRQNIRVSGYQEHRSEMGEDSRSGLMDLSMKGIGKTLRQMGKDD